MMVTTRAITFKLCKAPVKSSPTNQRPVFYRPDAPFVAQQCRSTDGKKSHSMDLLKEAHLGVFQLSLTTNRSCLPWREDCYASHQPSDANTPNINIGSRQNITPLLLLPLVLTTTATVLLLLQMPRLGGICPNECHSCFVLICKSSSAGGSVD